MEEQSDHLVFKNDKKIKKISNMQLYSNTQINILNKELFVSQ